MPHLKKYWFKFWTPEVVNFNMPAFYYHNNYHKFLLKNLVKYYKQQLQSSVNIRLGIRL